MVGTEVKRAAVAVCLAFSAVANAPVTQADALDDQFIASLGNQGINGQADQLIAFGRSFCDNVGGIAAVGPFYGLMASQGLAPQQVATVQMLAVKIYCPDKSAMLGPMGMFLPQLNP